MILAIDPGSRPGACVLDPATGRIVAASHRIEDVAGQGTWPIAVTESQWYQANRGKGRTLDVNTLLTLAFRAGWQFRGVSALRYMKLPPKVWRGVLGYGSLSKEQVQKKIARDLTPDERKLFSVIPASRHGDVLDAIALARAAAMLAETTTEYDYE